MKQYQFEATHRDRGYVEHIRATASTSEIAWAQIVLMYGSQFEVNQHHSEAYPPHHILGEIDCSDFPLADTDWLMREVGKMNHHSIN